MKKKTIVLLVLVLAMLTVTVVHAAVGDRTIRVVCKDKPVISSQYVNNRWKVTIDGDCVRQTGDQPPSSRPTNTDVYITDTPTQVAYPAPEPTFQPYP